MNTLLKKDNLEVLIFFIVILVIAYSEELFYLALKHFG